LPCDSVLPAPALRAFAFAAHNRGRVLHLHFRIEPDLVVVNARVLTMAPSAPRAEAFAVKNGRFVAVGSSADVRNLASARTQVIDAGGQTVTTGFIDAHCHVSGIDELFGVNTNVRTVRPFRTRFARERRTHRRGSGSTVSCSTTPSSRTGRSIAASLLFAKSLQWVGHSRA
jgi:predicted amidohydrolase YtcJ